MNTLVKPQQVDDTETTAEGICSWQNNFSKAADMSRKNQ